jgi:hypothetical protein
VARLGKTRQGLKYTASLNRNAKHQQERNGLPELSGGLFYFDTQEGESMKHEIIYLPIGKLKPNPDNPRLIRDANFKRLVKSLKDCPQLFDARPCICSDRTGDLIVLGGNMRLMAAKELKYSEVPVIVMSGLTPEQEREIVVKDNGENFGEWDFSLLSGWDDLPLKDWGVDLPEDWLKEIEITEDNSDKKSDCQQNECPKCGYKWNSNEQV